MTPTSPLWFRIGEVAERVGVTVATIRYWEASFRRWFRVDRSRGGQRIYSRAHVQRFERIRDLLYVERYTIVGARMRMEAESAQAAPSDAEGVA